MAENDKKQKINERVESYADYFKEEMTLLNDVLAKVSGYEVKVDDKLTQLENLPPTVRGKELHYVEQLRNAMTIQSEKKMLIKDIIGLKKSMIDYTLKDNKQDSSGESILEYLQGLDQRRIEKLQGDVEVKSEITDEDIEKILEEDE